MSRISNIEQARHFIITDEEVKRRFYAVIHDFGLPVQNGLNMKDMTGHRLTPQVFVDSSFDGNIHKNNFSSSVFFESRLSGDIRENDFQESDFLGGSISGNFLDNHTQGMYLRYVDISGATFKDSPPKKNIILQDDEVTVHKTTGRIIFCSGVENSIIKSEKVATFRPITIRLSDDSTIPFLARLYYDGEHRKLGLISMDDILFTTSSGSSRLWPDFIYTLTNESKPLRDKIEADFLRELPNMKDSSHRILPKTEYGGLGKVSLRPARPIDKAYVDVLHRS